MEAMTASTPRDDLKKEAAQLRKLARQAEEAAGSPRQSREDARRKDAERKRGERASDKNVIIPQCADRERRELLETDDEEWLLYYFAPESGCLDPFTYAFTSQQKEMIAAIRSAVRDGEDQALAATRGEGKTTYFERLLLKYTLQGVVQFSAILAATGGAAEDSLESIKQAIETNDRLAEDYPEVCIPVRALENTPNRAHYQTVTGKRHDNGEPYEQIPSKFSWCGQEVYFPDAPGSPSASAIIATRGLDSAIRGLRKKGRRPQVVGIDDPDTEDTARSEEQAKKIETRIDRAIAGLGSQKRRVARVMLTTLQSRISVSYKYTDPKQKPAWRGRRFRFLVTPPQRADLWEEYVALRQDDWRNGSSYAREFYAERFDEMNAGAVVANPNRKDAANLTALQFYFDQIARTSKEAVATEYDNDPPEESGPIESGLTPHRIQRQLSGLGRGVIPEDATIVVRGIDVRKIALHWAVRAWKPYLGSVVGYTIDYGVHEIHGTTYGSDEGADVAIRRGILSYLDDTKEKYGRRLDLTLIDAGYKTDAVYSACMQASLAGESIMPIMGHGKSAGCARANFSEVQKNTPDRKPGDGWFLSRQGNVWLVNADADRWKAWEHERWMTSPDKPGSLLLFGSPGRPGERLTEDEKAHHSYSHHICAETEAEELIAGVLRRRFKKKSDNNHWLDASYYSDVAANIRGIRLDGMRAAKPTKYVPGITTPKQRLSLAEMAMAAR